MSKFKKYRNNYTNSPVIYSSEDFDKMDINEVVSRNNELKSQYKQIGLPTPEELNNSSNVVYINEYTRADGTVVRAHWRSKGNYGKDIIPNDKPTVFDEKIAEVIMDKPQNQQKYPLMHNNPVLQGGVVINDETPNDLSSGEEGVFETIIDAIPIVLGILSSIITNTNISGDDIENLSISDIPKNINSTDAYKEPNIEVFDTKSDDIKIKQSQRINPKKFVQKFVNTVQYKANNVNDISNIIHSKDSNISINNMQKVMQSVEQPEFINVSNNTSENQINQQGVEFEPTEKSISVRQTIKPLNSNTQDYINEFLKNSKNNSKNELNTRIKKFVEKYGKFDNKLNNDVVKNIEHKWITPVDLNKYKIVSSYGMRYHPIKKRNILHDGIDINTPSNTSVKSVADGTVVKAEWYNGYGKYIEIKHTDETVSFYGHLSQISVKQGQKIKQGEIIGKTGNTGQSTGPHLHWGARKNNKSINPKNLLNNNII